MEASSSKLMGWLQMLQLVVTVGLAILGYSLNRDTEDAKLAIQRIEADLKARQEDRAAQEAAEKLRFQLFGHVSSAIEKKDIRLQEAAKALVVALLAADDTLRGGLIEVLTAQADPALKPVLEKVVVQEREFRQQEDALRATIASAVATATQPSADALSSYFVDVFHCQKDDPALKARAEDLVGFLMSKTLRARSRVLADSLNSSPGYRVTGLQVRYNQDELGAARELQRVLAEGKKGEFALRLVSSPTPRYMSVFVCG